MARPRIRRYLRHGLLPQLIAFEACMRLGGVTRAAEELALAQSTVSGLLRRLSDTVGAPLLHAHGGRVELTDAGHAVARLCEEILESLQRFEQARGLQRVETASTTRSQVVLQPSPLAMPRPAAAFSAGSARGPQHDVA